MSHRPFLAALALSALLSSWGCSEAPNEGPASGSQGAAGTGGSGAASASSGAATGGAGATGATGGAGGEPPVAEVHFLGRFDKSEPDQPRFAWSGSTIRARFSGTAIDVALDSEEAEVYFEVFVDGADSATFFTDAGPQVRPLASGLAEDEHDIEILRRVQAFNGVVQYQGFQFPSGGALVPSPAPFTRRLEVVGASYSCGAGVMGPDRSCALDPPYENAHKSFGAVAARAVGAELHIVGWGGKGMYQNSDGSTDEPMPTLFPLTLPEDPESAWDFDSWTADAVAVHVGRNDFSNPVDQSAYESAYVAFLEAVRGHYPEALIVCIFGPMKSPLEQVYTQNAVDTFADPRVKLVEFPDPDPADGLGCDGHPSEATQTKYGEILTEVLQAELGW